MNYQGVLTKMQTENGSPIQYYLVFENDFLNVNQLLNKQYVVVFEPVSHIPNPDPLYQDALCSIQVE
jgi:hypothetical protein